MMKCPDSSKPTRKMHWVGSVQRLIFPLATDAGLNSRWMTEQMAVVLQFHKNDVSRAATTILNHASEGGDHLVATLQALQNFNHVPLSVPLPNMRRATSEQCRGGPLQSHCPLPSWVKTGRSMLPSGQNMQQQQFFLLPKLMMSNRKRLF